MASVNKVIILGNLGKDPEVRYTPDGAAAARFSVATTRAWNDATTKEKRSETEWHRIFMYGRLAEIAGEYLKKGSQVYIEGRLRTLEWTDKNNIKRYTTEIYAESMQMNGNREPDSTQKPATPPPQAVAQANNPPSQTTSIEGDIPF